MDRRLSLRESQRRLRAAKGDFTRQPTACGPRLLSVAEEHHGDLLGLRYRKGNAVLLENLADGLRHGQRRRFLEFLSHFVRRVGQLERLGSTGSSPTSKCAAFFAAGFLLAFAGGAFFAVRAAGFFFVVFFFT